MITCRIDATVSRNRPSALHILLWLLPALPVIYLWDFWVNYRDQLLWLTYQHLRMIVLAMPPAVFLGVVLGIWIHGARHEKPRRAARRSRLVIGIAAVIMTVPSIALFGMMIPFLAPLGAGVGLVPSILALVLYSQLPIIRNTVVGLGEISPEVRKAATGMGMNRWQILRKVEMPLALPVILSGIRTAVVLSVGVAAVAAYIGGGGLGRWIFGGIRRTYPEMMLAGAVTVSLLALLLDGLLALLQRKLLAPAFSPPAGSEGNRKTKRVPGRGEA